MSTNDSNFVHSCLSDQKKRSMTAMSYAATGTTHRAGHVESFQSLLVVIAGVLRASIAVMKQAVRVGFPRLNGVTKSRADQWCGEAF